MFEEGSTHNKFDVEWQRQKLPSNNHVPINKDIYQPVIRRDSRSMQASWHTQDSVRTQAPKPRLPILGNLSHHDSTSTLVGSAFEQKIKDNSKPNMTERLDDLMAKDNLDY